jgi:hypothetical protein
LIGGAEGDELQSLQALASASEKRLDDATSALAKAEEELAAVKPAAAPLPPVPSAQPAALTKAEEELAAVKPAATPLPDDVPSAQPAAVQQGPVQANLAAPDALPTVVAQVVGTGSSSAEQTPSPNAKVAGKKRKEREVSKSQGPNAKKCVRRWIPSIIKSLQGMGTAASKRVERWLSDKSKDFDRLVKHMRMTCIAKRGKNKGKPSVDKMEDNKPCIYLRSQVKRALSALYSDCMLDDEDSPIYDPENKLKGEMTRINADIVRALVPAINEVEAVFLAEPAAPKVVINGQRKRAKKGPVVPHGDTIMMDGVSPESDSDSETRTPPSSSSGVVRNKPVHWADPDDDSDACGQPDPDSEDDEWRDVLGT